VLPKGEAVFFGYFKSLGRVGDDIVGDSPVFFFELGYHDGWHHADDGSDKLGVVEIFGFGHVVSHHVSEVADVKIAPG
jgi:hypothetical protein